MSRILALDVGERRIGVAVSDLAGVQARPLEVIARRSKADDHRRVASLITAHGVQRLVVGLPLNADDSVGPRARRIERYARALVEALNEEGIQVELVLWDEHGSTRRAHDALLGAGRSARARRERIDAAAAAVILQDYVDALRGVG